MAACTFGGASSVKVSNLSLNLNLGFERTKLGTSQALHGLRSRTPVPYQSLAISRRSGSASIGCRCSSEAKAFTNLEDDSEGGKSFGTTSQLIPSPYEVESLLVQICDTTSIAEFELKLGGFRLYVTRDLTGKSEPPSPPISAPFGVSETVEAPDLNGSVPPLSLAISKPLPSSSGVRSLLASAEDEGLVILKSPGVGNFRRCRIIKGNLLPPSCKEGQTVREGKVVCFIEQLGGRIPLSSTTSGEVIKILRKDGDPVGYGDPLIAILPSFPGIKKLH